MRTFFLRDYTGFPVACVASEISDDKSIIRFTVSTWNPKDKYDKVMGRSIAQERLTKNRKKKITTLTLQPGQKAKRQVMESILANEAMPKRTRGAAGYWLFVDTFAASVAEKVKDHAEVVQTTA